MDLERFNFNHRREAAIIIGAGATRGAHFVTPGTICKPPMDEDFFQLMASSGVSTDESRKLLSFVVKEFGSLQVGMETFYSQAFLYDQFIHDVPKGGRGRRREFKSNLNHFQRVLPQLFAMSLEGRECAFHSGLVSALSPGDTFISFNYDCILDRALSRYGGRRWRPSDGYGYPIALPSDAWFDHTGKGRLPKRSIGLLKPHGSLNWRFEGDKLSLREDEYGIRQIDELVIIPPLWQKSFDTEPYQSIWQKTRQVLSSVKALFVVGYSLPETDVYTQATLRMDVGNLDFLCLVNPDHSARTRILRTLRSSISASTHVVEFQRLSDLAEHLPKIALVS